VPYNLVSASTTATGSLSAVVCSALTCRNVSSTCLTNSYITFKPTKTQKSSGKQVDIFITDDINDVLVRARNIKKQFGIISDYVFSKRDCTPYKKDGLRKMWDSAKARAGITEDITFRDIRSLGATDAAKAGEDRKDIQKRLAHTSAKTTEIYIKEVIPEKSNLTSKLPW
jgi:integrase